MSEAWERQADEPTRAHAAFRIYRDLAPHQRDWLAVADKIDAKERTVRAWAGRWDWRGRADAWDDACHRVEDAERLDAIRSMHEMHRKAGRAAVVKAVQGLGLLDPADMPPTLIARLLELGAKLERSTLLTSVEELQGLDTEEESEDPWERIARELDPAASAQL